MQYLQKRNVNMTKNQKYEKRNMLVNIIIAAIAGSALVVSIVSMVYSCYGINDASYYKPLSYTITIREPDNKEENKTVKLFNNAASFASQRIILSPYSGAIRTANIIYYYKNTTYAILPLELLSNVNREQNNAQKYDIAITDFKQYAYAKGEATDNFKKEGYQESYYTCIYIVTEDFNHDYDVRLLVFEYPLDNNGNIIADIFEYREYSELYQLLNYNSGWYKPLPEFDAMALSDFSSLYNIIDKIAEE